MKSKKTKAFILELIVDVLIVIALVLLIREYLYAPFKVDGPSMCDTFNIFEDQCIQGPGEVILTSRLPTWSIFGFSFSNLKHGDIVVFEAPYSDKDDSYIKRVIGLPGDTIKISDGFVYIQNSDGEFVQIDETYLNETNYGNTQAYKRNEMTYEVPEGTLFVLGDNRQISSDSRRCFLSSGCDANTSPYLDMDLVQGKVKIVIFPLSHVRWVRR